MSTTTTIRFPPDHPWWRHPIRAFRTWRFKRSLRGSWVVINGYRYQIREFKGTTITTTTPFAGPPDASNTYYWHRLDNQDSTP